MLYIYSEGLLWASQRVFLRSLIIGIGLPLAPTRSSSEYRKGYIFPTNGSFILASNNGIICLAEALGQKTRRSLRYQNLEVAGEKTNV